MLAALLGAVVLAGAAMGAGRLGSSRPEISISSNWAGYAANALDVNTTIAFRSAAGTWKQPRVRCTVDDAGAASSVWVGLGGYGTGSEGLEQIGTVADCSRLGKPVYYAWYELLPSTTVKLKLTIRPGDTITASVRLNRNETTARLSLTNRTRGTGFSKTLPLEVADSGSAEWIVEAPALCNRFSCHPSALANFGSVSITKIALSGNGHVGTLTDSAWVPVRIRLSPDIGEGGFFPGGPYPEQGSAGSTAGAVPTVLSADGRSFSVRWNGTATLPRGALAAGPRAALAP